MHAKPDLRVFLKWMIAGSGSVITDVIQHQFEAYERSTKTTVFHCIAPVALGISCNNHFAFNGLTRARKGETGFVRIAQGRAHARNYRCIADTRCLIAHIW